MTNQELNKANDYKEMKQRIEKVLARPLEYYTSDNTDSIKGLMEAMINVNTDDKPITEKESDLLDLMDIVQQSKSYTIRQLASHMWVTVGQYYMFLMDLKQDNYTNLNLLLEETKETKETEQSEQTSTEV